MLPSASPERTSEIKETSLRKLHTTPPIPPTTPPLQDQRQPAPCPSAPRPRGEPWPIHLNHSRPPTTRPTPKATPNTPSRFDPAAVLYPSHAKKMASAARPAATAQRAKPKRLSEAPLGTRSRRPSAVTVPGSHISPCQASAAMLGSVHPSRDPFRQLPVGPAVGYHQKVTESQARAHQLGPPEAGGGDRCGRRLGKISNASSPGHHQAGLTGCLPTWSAAAAELLREYRASGSCRYRAFVVPGAIELSRSLIGGFIPARRHRAPPQRRRQ